MDDTTARKPFPSDAETIARLAHDGVPVHEVLVGDSHGERPALLFFGNGPAGHRIVHVEDLEPRGEEPVRKRGTIEVYTPDAVVAYASRHLDVDRNTLWADVKGGRIVVVLNDHAETMDRAGWADHRVNLQMRRSDEWEAWTGLAGQWVTQEDLAVFLEEHLQDVAVPDGSTLLEVAQTFHATTDATFQSTKRLADGTQHLVWHEDVNATAGRGQQTAIPTDLTVLLRPWIGVDPVEVAGKFRFRIRDGALRLRVDLLRTGEASRQAVEQAAVYVGEQLGGVLQVIEGVAPSSRMKA